MSQLMATLDKRPVAFRILRNAGSILLGNIGGELLTTYAIALAALSLGPAGFGRLSEAQAFMDPFETAAGFGLTQVAITVAAKRGECDGTLRGTIFGIRSVFAVLAIVSAIIAVFTTGRQMLAPIVVVLSIGTLFGPVSTSATLPFQFNQTMHMVLALPFLASIVRIATTFIALHTINTPVGHQLSATTSALASAILIFVAAQRYYPSRLRFDRKLARDLLKLAWPAAALEITIIVYSRGSYLLLHETGAVAQGEFAAAERLLRPVFGIAAAVFMSALPTLAVLAAERDFGRITKIYATSVVRLALVVSPIVGAACFLTPWLLQTFVPAYAGAASPFRWLAVGAFFMLLNQLSTTFVIAMGKFRVILGIATINFAVYFALASHLIPRYQATGAAMATTIMEAANTIIQLVAVYWLLQRSRRDRQIA